MIVNILRYKTLFVIEILSLSRRGSLLWSLVEYNKMIMFKPNFSITRLYQYSILSSYFHQLQWQWQWFILVQFAFEAIDRNSKQNMVCKVNKHEKVISELWNVCQNSVLSLNRNHIHPIVETPVRRDTDWSCRSVLTMSWRTVFDDWNQWSISSNEVLLRH